VRADVTRVKNQLGALCRARGLHDVTKALYLPSSRAEAIAALPEHYRLRAELLCAELDGRSGSCQAAEHWLLEEAKRVPIIQRLTTAPGIGELRAAQIVATVVTPHRFRTKRQFWSYCGLAIVTRSSSDYVQDRHGRWVYKQDVVLTRGLNRNRQPLLKNVFKGAALTVANQMPNHPLHHSYQRALDSTKPNLARLTLARRIAAAVLAMWKNDEDYDPAKHRRA
jgi:transposase